MIKKFWSFKKQLDSVKKGAEYQTVRLFAILAGLTLVFVLMMKIVQFTPNTNNQLDMKLSTEAKISPK